AIFSAVHAEDHVIELNLGFERSYKGVARITVLLVELGRARHLDPEPKIAVAIFLPGRRLRPRRGRDQINRGGSGCERSQSRHDPAPRPARVAENQMQRHLRWHNLRWHKFLLLSAAWRRFVLKKEHTCLHLMAI